MWRLAAALPFTIRFIFFFRAGLRFAALARFRTTRFFFVARFFLRAGDRLLSDAANASVAMVILMLQ